MTIRCTCPDCDTTFRIPEDQGGMRVRCPSCEASFRAPRSRVTDDEIDSEPEERPRPRKKRKKSASIAWGKYGVAVLGVGVLVLGVGLLVYLMYSLPGWLKTAEPVIAADKWKPLEVPGRFRILLPGETTRKEQPIQTITMVMHAADVSKTLFCGVGYTEGQLPPERRNLPADQLLEDACNGAIAQSGGTEVRRTPITIGRHPGRELLISVKGQGKAINRIYLVNGSIYTLIVAGKGIEPEGEIARKVFTSFELTGNPN